MKFDKFKIMIKLTEVCMLAGKQMCKGINRYWNSVIVHKYYLNMMDPEMELKKIFRVIKVTSKQTGSNNEVANRNCMIRTMSEARL